MDETATERLPYLTTVYPRRLFRTVERPRARRGYGAAVAEWTDEMTDDERRQAVIDLLALLAYTELTAFERLAEDARWAPSIGDKVALAEMAAAEFAHFQVLRERLEKMGVDAEVSMRPFVGPLDAFHDSTAPSDWLESVVKAYVGDGFAADFYREVAEYVDPEARALVLDVLEDTGHAQFAVDHLRAAIAAHAAAVGRPPRRRRIRRSDGSGGPPGAVGGTTRRRGAGPSPTRRGRP